MRPPRAGELPGSGGAHVVVAVDARSGRDLQAARHRKAQLRETRPAHPLAPVGGIAGAEGFPGAVPIAGGVAVMREVAFLDAVEFEARRPTRTAARQREDRAVEHGACGPAVDDPVAGKTQRHLAHRREMGGVRGERILDVVASLVDGAPRQALAHEGPAGLLASVTPRTRRDVVADIIGQPAPQTQRRIVLAQAPAPVAVAVRDEPVSNGQRIGNGVDPEVLQQPRPQSRRRREREPSGRRGKAERGIALREATVEVRLRTRAQRMVEAREDAAPLEPLGMPGDVGPDKAAAAAGDARGIVEHARISPAPLAGAERARHRPLPGRDEHGVAADRHPDGVRKVSSLGIPAAAEAAVRHADLRAFEPLRAERQTALPHLAAPQPPGAVRVSARPVGQLRARPGLGALVASPQHDIDRAPDGAARMQGRGARIEYLHPLDRGQGRELGGVRSAAERIGRADERYATTVDEEHRAGFSRDQRAVEPVAVVGRALGQEVVKTARTRCLDLGAVDHGDGADLERRRPDAARHRPRFAGRRRRGARKCQHRDGKDERDGRRQAVWHRPERLQAHVSTPYGYPMPGSGADPVLTRSPSIVTITDTLGQRETHAVCEAHAVTQPGPSRSWPGAIASATRANDAGAMTLTGGGRATLDRPFRSPARRRRFRRRTPSRVLACWCRTEIRIVGTDVPDGTPSEAPARGEARGWRVEWVEVPARGPRARGGTGTSECPASSSGRFSVRAEPASGPPRGAGATTRT